MRISRLRPAVAAMLLLVVTAAPSLPWALPNAELSGRVLRADNVTPR